MGRRLRSRGAALGRRLRPGAIVPIDGIRGIALVTLATGGLAAVAALIALLVSLRY